MSFSQGPVQDHAKASDGLSLGYPQNLLTRTEISQEPFYARIYRKNFWGPRAGQPRYPHFVQACAVEMHMDLSQEQFLCENLQQKCRAPRSGQPRGAHFVRACAIEMHMNISGERCY